MRTGHVYALYDVREPGIYRYVGKTVEGTHRRLYRHRRSFEKLAHLHVVRWMRRTGAWNVRIESLGEYPINQLLLRERQWIVTLEQAGFNLTNAAPGGQTSGFARGHYRHSAETIARMVATRRARNSDYGAPWQGKTRDAATRAAIAAGLNRYHAVKAVQQN